MLVVDTSVFIDSIIPVKGKGDRNRLARKAISSAEARGIPLLMPRLGVVETISLAKRLTGKEGAVDLTMEYLEAKVLQVSEDWIFEDAKTIARKIHPRAADSYFIATAKKFNAILKDMVARARKMGIRAFYVLDKTQLDEYLNEISGGAV
ncbi:type II toxin-antitoxin system VapC family toxin [Thermococcus waiotapuensis]|uniref:Type II toxin-antitoxin system VapC family toxin n=1 Tax=Thermococcus waiotapuensis TaxID=90909 RepID=A0AAE4T3R7_9EURY|nr:type II toxin-antitoxin system VapC family toxin [Thermococcus waiotapuensis]MDV3104078.1 type II toxin-antitoxin system VapC family toxin [Thermococcus waiotapuensis]